MKILLFFILLGIGGSSNGSSPSTSTKVPTNDNVNVKEAKTTEVNYKVGEAVKTDKFEIIINSVEERSVVGSQYFEKKPSKGSIFVAVQYQYKNITNKPIGSFSTPQIKLVDKNGTEYSADAGASGNFATELNLDRKIFSHLNPGITVNDAAIFEISKEQYADSGWNLLVKGDKDIKASVK